MMQKQRNIGLDVLKGFAALLVCMLHLVRVDFGEVIPGETYIPNITKIFYGLCASSVPIFFFTNGYLVGCRQNEPKSILFKIFNLLKVRLIVGVFTGFLICLLRDKTHSFANYMAMSFYLWFLEALVVIYVWVLIWDRIKNYKWSVIIPILLFLVPFLSNFIGLLATLFGHRMSDFWGHFGFFRLYGVFYFILPFYLKRKVLPRWWAIAFVVVGLAIVALEVYVWTNVPGSWTSALNPVYDGMNACFPTVGALLMTLGLFSLFTTAEYNDKNVIVKYFAWLGRNCMGIYLFHLPFVFVFYPYLCDSIIPAICAIAVSLAIISCCSLIYSWITKNKYINYILKI